MQKAHKLSEPFTVLKYDLEISGFGSQALGHVCLLNLRDQTYPGSDGTKTKGWPTWTTPLMKWAKAQGAYTGYAHSASGLGVNAQSDAELVRVPIPPLTEERRREFVKVVKHKGEEHKIAIRNERRDAKEMVEEAVKEGEISEDEGKKAQERVQAEVDAGIKKVDEIIANKEKDLMQV